MKNTISRPEPTLMIITLQFPPKIFKGFSQYEKGLFLTLSILISAIYNPGWSRESDEIRDETMSHHTTHRITQKTRSSSSFYPPKLLFVLFAKRLANLLCHSSQKLAQHRAIATGKCHSPIQSPFKILRG